MKNSKLIMLINSFSQNVEHYITAERDSAKIRNRGDAVFPAEHRNVSDNKDHFPINNLSQARNALARVNQYSSAPNWYKGSLQSLVDAVVRAVKKKYPSIEVSDKASNPGKN